MAKSHPAYAQFDDQGAPLLAQRALNIPGSFALLACVVFVSSLLYDQHGVRVASALVHSIAAFDLTPLVMPSDDPHAPDEADPNQTKYRGIGDYLARRYRVSAELATSVVSWAYTVGHETKLDPLLILAVISIESSFNPLAESSMGAKGLMQVIPRFHTEKFEPLGGEGAAFDLEANITVGAQILKQYLRRAGDLAEALRMYVGASSDANENGFSAKVMAERERLHYVLLQLHDAAPTLPPQAPAKLASAS